MCWIQFSCLSSDTIFYLVEQKSVAEQTKVKDNASDHEVGFDEYERPSELQRKQKQKSAMADLLNRRKEKREG